MINILHYKDTLISLTWCYVLFFFVDVIIFAFGLVFPLMLLFVFSIVLPVYLLTVEGVCELYDGKLIGYTDIEEE